MKRKVLKDKTAAVKNETATALQVVWDATNKGQRNKLLKNEGIAKLFERYGVQTTG